MRQVSSAWRRGNSLNRHCLFLVTAFIALALSACVTAEGYAQQATVPRHIEVVAMALDAQSKEAKAFRQALRDAGYVEGRDISVDWRSGGGDYEHVSEAVADTVQRKVDVIVVVGTPVALAAKRLTGTIPVVMALVADPLGSGLVTSLARPGGNVTGLSAMVVELSAKRLQLLKEAIPTASRVGVMFNPDSPYNSRVIGLLKAAARGVKVQLTSVGVRRVEEFLSAFSTLRRSKVDVLMVLDDAFMATHEETILRLASNARLPVVMGKEPRTGQGALLSYGPDYPDLFRRAAGYVDKLLKGASAADLPIEQPTRFELVVNLRSARTLGLTIPQSVLLQADEVIQ